jgi:hypothetical protein
LGTAVALVQQPSMPTGRVTGRMSANSHRAVVNTTRDNASSVGQNIDIEGLATSPWVSSALTNRYKVAPDEDLELAFLRWPIERAASGLSVDVGAARAKSTNIVVPVARATLSLAHRRPLQHHLGHTSIGHKGPARLAKRCSLIVELGTATAWTAITLALDGPERRIVTYDPFEHLELERYLNLVRPDVRDRIEMVAAPGPTGPRKPRTGRSALHRLFTRA